MTFLTRILAPVFAAALCAAGSVSAHEFWIAPEQYQVPAGGTIEARFRNGENFEGVELAFFDRNSVRLQTVQGGTATDLTPRNGDRPAIVIEAAPDGLMVLAHETTRSSLTYREWAKFLKFAAHKDFPDIEARHDARGLPRAPFRESYSRHVKALIGVGAGTGADSRLGLQTEFVVLTNPYEATFTQTMRAQLFYRDAIRPDAQVEIFDKAPDGTVEVRLTRTDADGIAEFPTQKGHHYLIDAVVLREPEQDADKYAWETLWAGLSFAVPE